MAADAGEAPVPKCFIMCSLEKGDTVHVATICVEAIEAPKEIVAYANEMRVLKC